MWTVKCRITCTPVGDTIRWRLYQNIFKFYHFYHIFIIIIIIIIVDRYVLCIRSVVIAAAVHKSGIAKSRRDCIVETTLKPFWTMPPTGLSETGAPHTRTHTAPAASQPPPWLHHHRRFIIYLLWTATDTRHEDHYFNNNTYYYYYYYKSTRMRARNVTAQVKRTTATVASFRRILFYYYVRRYSPDWVKLIDVSGVSMVGDMGVISQPETKFCINYNM